jgi:beta-lactam-binding protein with PASTA domain
VSRFRQYLDWAKPVLRSRYLWLMLSGLGAFLLLIYVVVDQFVMPTYTRHSVAVLVPDTRGLPVAEADSILSSNDLEIRHVVAPYVPTLARDAVVDQDPEPFAYVKPGRRVYLKVNSGSAPMVLVPTLYDLSIRQARTTLLGSKLTVGTVLRDKMPSPYENTVTRQAPQPGDSVIVGGAVDLWISSGLSSAVAQVPELVGEDVSEAEYLLERSKLQFVLFEVTDAGNAFANAVVRVIPPTGSQLPQGSEIRLFVAPPDSTYGPPMLPLELRLLLN